MNIIVRAAWYFAGHPDVNEFYITSDGMGFFIDSDAESHARTLADRKVYPVKRYPNEEEARQYLDLFGATEVDGVDRNLVAAVIAAMDRLVDMVKSELNPKSPPVTTEPTPEPTQETEQTKETEPVLPVQGDTSPQTPAGAQEGDPAHDQGVVSEEDPAPEKKKPGRKPAAK